MRYSVERLQTDVMSRLGEIARPQGVVDTAGIPWPEDVVAVKVVSCLADEGSRILREADAALLGCGVVGVSGCEVVGRRLMACGMYAAEVRLPEVFLRLVSVSMAGWRRGVCFAVSPGSADWNRQWSAEPGIAGCPESPRAYMDADGSGRLLRLVGSASQDDVLESLTGWCVPKPDDDGGFGFPESLYPELVAAIAAKI